MTETTIERLARVLAKKRYGDDGYREEDDGVQYWELCVDDVCTVLTAAQDIPNSVRDAGEIAFASDFKDPMRAAWVAMLQSILTEPTP